ncbi:hypothetical protein [Sulfuriroseicoccus oceanibius]|uniref:Uncharacterized protein n=1 Tax=Sulfuriroseicoccus oceanibius TaxID=2707525 RepID=A0A6B3L4B6_9BACT|nr:hypothetical protein [Sulfuriroseicoccus oceanibius]QQL46301.1 hypothetical protein G3M56_006935 [Sulfuriroseicoccus oceanibius]
MGLFDKVKSLANAITGNAAKVSVTAAPVTMGEPFEVTVQAVANDSDVNFSRVYVEVRGVESIDVPSTSSDDDNRVYRSETTYTAELNVTGAGTLAAGANESWTGEVTIPLNAPAIYRGKYAEHVYEVRAGLDCPGNDPDSGWVRVHLA